MNSKSQGETPSFTAPRHWLGPEELQASYWADAQVLEKRSQEFFDKPVELIDKIDKTDASGIARRDFLTIMGASMAMATLSCARRPVHKIIPYVVVPEEVVPGAASFYASTCKECSVGCGVLVKNREGRPIKLEGNPEHPANRGALCGQGQASLLNLYDPDRLQSSISKTKGQASGTEISWEDSDKQIGQKLQAIAARGGRVRVLTGTLNSPSTEKLIGEFLAGFQNGKRVVYDPLSLGEISDAQDASYGTRATPRYHFDKASYVLSLGADFLGNWVSPVEFSRDWGQVRKLDSKNPAGSKFSKLVMFESIFSVTGANADERHPVRSGDEYRVAMAIAYELIVNRKLSRFAADSAVVNALQGYKPEVIAAEIGLDGSADAIRKTAAGLWDARGKGLVVGGGISTRTSQTNALQVAVNLLNSALDNEGETVVGNGSVLDAGSTYSGLAALVDEMKSGQVDALIIYKTNPSYTTPRVATGLEEAMKKVSMVVSIGDHADETSRFADYVLADHHYLENWGDASPWRGVTSLQQPSIAPLYATRAFEDTLLAWAKAAQLKVSARMSGSADWHAYLMSNWKDMHGTEHVAADFQTFWESCLRDGVYTAKSQAAHSARAFRSSSVSALTKFAPAASNGMTLALYESMALGDGTSANNPWLQELPDPVSSITWDNYLNVGVAAAKSMDLTENDVVEVKSTDVTVQLPVHIQPGMHPSSVSVAIGYGRRSVGKVGNFAGVDVFPLVKAQRAELIYAGLPVTISKTGKFYKLATTQYHTATENRPVINDITLAQFKKNPGTTNETEPELKLKEIPSIWGVHEYKGYRWGMSIDLTQCFGCGACVLACQAENNIPVVGRNQVRNSRQMHWIRIDRYFSGSPEQPEVLFQPMLCQHCENAPCETVCPVLATVHDDEGLNVQVYNRCVGTRYCQNNCPYKVRRFNFFDHWKNYEGAQNLAWNPDVTVRSRGIMEKCTFCVQRIRDSKDRAKDMGSTVLDGDLKTACQQTCPTDAIVFGDLNNPATKVSTLANEERTFRALEVLNTRPAVSYMTKVRNVERAGAEAAEGSHS